MFTKSANRLTNSLIHNEVISESDFELYSFGFETAFAITANIITTVLIGALFHMTLESLLFLAAFIPLRSYVGGFHASNHFRCYWLSILAVVLVLFAARFILDAYHVFIVMGIGVICPICKSLTRKSLSKHKKSSKNALMSTRKKHK